MKNIFGIAVAAMSVASPASADINVMTMAKANGLAEIVINSEQCGYAIDQAKLEEYYSKNGLDTPEALTMITNSIELAKFTDSVPSASACTMSKATAKKLGLLVP